MKEYKERGNLVYQKSKAFAIRVVKLYQYLCEQHREYVLSKQLLRSGTSIGANISEAQGGISKRDFLSKLYISLKETWETKYWIELLHETGYLEEKEYASIHEDCVELLKILTTITKTTKLDLATSPNH